MEELLVNLQAIDTNPNVEKETILNDFIARAKDAGYEIVEVNGEKPWGAYIRFSSSDADRFVNEFFPGLTPEEARLGIVGAELSPKFLIVTPNQRLSWQYHDRRAERWAFLSDGAYHKSVSDEQGEPELAKSGDVVQFMRGERHRLVGTDGGYTVVAEIWQHSDPDAPSDESDIVRLSDDYKR